MVLTATRSCTRPRFRKWCHPRALTSTAAPRPIGCHLPASTGELLIPTRGCLQSLGSGLYHHWVVIARIIKYFGCEAALTVLVREISLVSLATVISAYTMTKSGLLFGRPLPFFSIVQPKGPSTTATHWSRPVRAGPCARNGAKTLPSRYARKWCRMSMAPFYCCSSWNTLSIDWRSKED